ncbi:MAG: tetratricopeptide repeat protein [Myxococcota bacterium]
MRATVLAWLLACAGCVLPGPRIGPSDALALHEVADQGDGLARASTDLVLQALDAEIRGDVARARGLYTRALQTDASNPYTYLALARHHAEQGDPVRTLEQLARAEDLLRAAGLESPRVEVHLVGLRGVALRQEGRVQEAEPLLLAASRSAPEVWGDGRLSARELR